MTILPTIWAGALSAGLSLAALALLIAHLTVFAKGVPHVISGVVAVFISVVVLSSGIDSILVHHERAIAVFAGLVIGAGVLILIPVKAFLR